MPLTSTYCWAFALIALIAPVLNAAPQFRTENIFPLQNKHCHSSSIVECPDGSLLVCWFHGSGERKADDVVVQGSRWSPTTAKWSPVFLMADTPDFPDCNPVLYIDRQERLWLFWICVLAHRWECSQLKYLRADDATGDGAPHWNWQDVIQLKPGDEFPQVLQARFAELKVSDGMWAEYAQPYHEMLIAAAQDPYKRQTGWMTRTHPLTLPSGRMLLPLYSDGFNTSLMGISDDQGATWRASSPIVGLGPIQPTVARRKDGTLLAYCRDSGDAPHRVLSARSTDDGQTWTPAIDIDVPNPGSSLEVMTLTSGKWVMIANDTEDGRHRLTLLVSDDEGETWPVKRTVEPSDPGGRTFGYPSIIQTRDGMIHLTYSYTADNGRAIRHCVTNEEWIMSGK